MPSIRTYIRTLQIIAIIAYIQRAQFIIYHSQITTDRRCFGTFAFARHHQPDQPFMSQLSFMSQRMVLSQR